MRPRDGLSATKLVVEVENAAKTPRLAKVVADPLKRAKAALERAHGARMSLDVEHGQMLEALALEWAETARDLLRAVAAEDAALAAGQKAREVEVQVERARALLEETQARQGRATADLERIEAEAAEAAKSAASAEETRLDAAGKKPAAKATKKSEGSPKKGEGAPKKPEPAAGKKGGAPAPRRSP